MKEYQHIPGYREELLSEPFVQHLLKCLTELSKKVEDQEKKLETLSAEIRVLKKLPKKPDIKASKLDEPLTERSEDHTKKKKRPGSEKRKKKRELEIHEHQKIKAKDVPEGWKLIGYKTRIIQDLIIRTNNISYQLEVWKDPQTGKKIMAQLPTYLQNTHFGVTLKSYIIHQYYECGVSQPLILTTLRDYGMDISSGQINNILIENKDTFHEEKLAILAKGLRISKELRTDDTTARHLFKNGFCNCINSDLFTYFTTTYTKSRINFLNILRLERTDYQINEAALQYIEKELPLGYLNILRSSYEQGQRKFDDHQSLMDYCKEHGIKAKYALKTIEESLLIGSIVEHGLDPNIVIHSDGARQFDLFVHSLCWKHAERPLVKIKCYHPKQAEQLEEKQKAFWLLYQQLKKYKSDPRPELITSLEDQFDQLCKSVTNFAALNQVLEELKAKKQKLLVVLTRPFTSLHNNDSERDIREYVKRRKISAGTRSENGRKARDTFLSLKKTCRKLGISFWEYLLDRLQHVSNIPSLDSIMENKVAMDKV